MNTTSTVAMIIDMQGCFVDDLYAVDKALLVESQTAILAYCAQEDIPVICVELIGCDGTIGPLKRVLKTVPRAHTVRKIHTDSFSNSQVHETLQGFGAKKLLLMGLNASACVLATAKSAVRHGYPVITAENLIANPRSCCGSKSRDWYQANSTFFRDILPPEQLLAAV
jgi:nicotinamidase-related amidase